MSARYDEIGKGYSRTRREDPELRARIHSALGTARTIVNVGSGTGLYEPIDRHVIAIEPSDVMAAQRPTHLAPALRGTAGSLPLRDASVDASMAILSVHHWDREQRSGIRELRRVSRGPVVILTYDPRVSNEMWLVKDYFPELAELDIRIFPVPEEIVELLGGGDVVTVPISRDTPDWQFGSFWAHPERVFDEQARNATSGFARAASMVVDRIVEEVRADLDSGNWEKRHGALRALTEYDAGLRLVVA